MRERPNPPSAGSRCGSGVGGVSPAASVTSSSQQWPVAVSVTLIGDRSLPHRGRRGAAGGVPGPDAIGVIDYRPPPCPARQMDRGIAAFLGGSGVLSPLV